MPISACTFGSPADLAPSTEATEPGQPIEIIVLGDVHWDAVTIENAGKTQLSGSNRANYTMISRPAGAWLLEKLVKDATQDVRDSITVRGYAEYSKDTKTPELLSSNRWRKALTELKLFPKGSPQDGGAKVYRIAHEQKYLWSSESVSKEAENAAQNIFDEMNDKIHDETSNFIGPPIVIIDDSGEIFHHLDSSQRLINKCREKNGYFIINMARSLNDAEDRKRFDRADKIWDALDPRRTTVIVSTTTLRDAGINIMEEWAVETAAHAFTHYMQTDKFLKKLTNSMHLIICHNTGVFHLDKSEEENIKFDFYFQQYEKSPILNSRKYGTMSDYRRILITSILVEALTEEAIKEGETPRRQVRKDLDINKPLERLSHGLHFGLKNCARHFGRGFSCYNLSAYGVDSGEEKEANVFGSLYNMPHPFNHLFLSKENDQFAGETNEESTNSSNTDMKLAWVRFPLPLDELSPTGIPKTWNRVTWFRDKLALLSKDGRLREKVRWLEGDPEKSYANWLVQVVERGVDAAQKELIDNNENTNEPRALFCPVAKFGKLAVVDHGEIDRYLNFQRIISKYLEDSSWNKPLSIAVFGPPGAGKSTAVEEILKSAISSGFEKESSDSPLVFNLAQFNDSSNLTNAFHQVQDKVLTAKGTPLIFFDEFDSTLNRERYGWLKYFLAPMQDGKFKGAEAAGSYSVGKAIFVFAGGTAETFEEFKKATSQIDPEIVNAKGKDFISRLRAFLDIKGIDISKDEDRVSDLLALRRAILLRSILIKNAKDIFDEATKYVRIDPELIRAFLWIDKYEHGIRSMTAIVEMSVPKRGRLQVASLPSGDQLRMHVNAEQFFRLATQA
jgi:hypothetical protein